ncbi:unnamed protein product [Allacma fusca]|uniref:DUF4806 domain-containing protein n=1 Tax=Allacma fusca TaxID=39272 RepID=A0A8J2NHZ6_9HEXA|nr:unnamed protein product [Allacma fusca]
MKPIFYIVEFLKDNSVAVVPSNWLLHNNTKSHWHVNTTDYKAIKLAQRAAEPLDCPEVEWKLYDCKLKRGSEFQKTALRQLVNIGSDVAQLTRKLSLNADRRSPKELEIPGICIPVNTPEEFRVLDDWLVQTENKAKFINYLKGIGGINTENFVKRILGRVIGAELANAANYSGARDKVKFKGHPLLQCIILAIRKSPEDTAPTDADVENVVKKWLLGSGDRNDVLNQSTSRRNDSMVNLIAPAYHHENEFRILEVENEPLRIYLTSSSSSQSESEPEDVSLAAELSKCGPGVNHYHFTMRKRKVNLLAQCSRSHDMASKGPAAKVDIYPRLAQLCWANTSQ